MNRRVGSAYQLNLLKPSFPTRYSINRKKLRVDRQPSTFFCKQIQNGEGEIRTPGAFRLARFQVECNRPLCHLSGQIYINNPWARMATISSKL